jgi:uncharacterized alpha-E superfamily protein
VCAARTTRLDVRATGGHRCWPSCAPAGDGRALRDEVVRSLTLDNDKPASVVSCISRARGRAHRARRDLGREPTPPNLLPVARFLLFERADPDSVAGSVESVRDALQRADRDPRNSEPVLRCDIAERFANSPAPPP